jgi:hypothetical protein
MLDCENVWSSHFHERIFRWKPNDNGSGPGCSFIDNYFGLVDAGYEAFLLRHFVFGESTTPPLCFYGRRAMTPRPQESVGGEKERRAKNRVFGGAKVCADQAFQICRYLVPYDTTEFDDAIFDVSCTVSSNDTMYIMPNYDGCGRHRRWEHTQMFEACTFY